ncbi:hypothetical protein F0231_00945 [Vibrio sp. RE86]|uniref:hypothetical protein n=1 Tax=Vibrio sp. RE86 TaxID=2607605 RepID=UPI00149346BB|nr:hypothetical protein [Vibrio sp. RE86]NOH78302.1 hypothetical protein [Vibrio sp. RE86]
MKSNKEDKLELYNSLVYRFILENGIESCTYEAISKYIGIPISTLQGYYPTKHHFIIALDNEDLLDFYRMLDYSSKENFVRSYIYESQRTGLLNKFCKNISMMLASPTIPPEYTKRIQLIVEYMATHVGQEKALEYYYAMWGSVAIDKFLALR